MLGRETRLPPDLIHPSPPDVQIAEEEYVNELQERMRTAGERLRAQHQLLPRSDEDELPMFAVDDRVWLKSFYKPGGRGTKLRPKYVGPYTITKVLPHQTYAMERNGKLSIQHEGRIRLYQSDKLPNTDESVLETEEIEECEETSVSEAVEEAVAQQQTWQPPRTRRNVRLPGYLQDYHLDLCDNCVIKLTSVQDSASILGQNSVSQGGGVVNLDMQRTINSKFESGGPEKGRCGNDLAQKQRSVVSLRSMSMSDSSALKMADLDTAMEETSLAGVGLELRDAGSHLRGWLY